MGKRASINYKCNFKSVIYQTIKKHYFQNDVIFIRLLVSRYMKTFFTTCFSFNNCNELKKVIITVIFSLFRILVILNHNNIFKQVSLKVIEKYLLFSLLKYIIRKSLL